MQHGKFDTSELSKSRQGCYSHQMAALPSLRLMSPLLQSLLSVTTACSQMLLFALQHFQSRTKCQGAEAIPLSKNYCMFKTIWKAAAQNCRVWGDYDAVAVSSPTWQCCCVSAMPLPGLTSPRECRSGCSLGSTRSINTRDIIIFASLLHNGSADSSIDSWLTPASNIIN